MDQDERRAGTCLEVAHAASGDRANALRRASVLRGFEHATPAGLNFSSGFCVSMGNDFLVDRFLLMSDIASIA